MHARHTVESALRLAQSGASEHQIAAVLDVPVRTIRDWLEGRVPHSAWPDTCDRCLGRHDVETLGSEYPYLFGLYLGDGCLSWHRRDVYKLRVTLDRRYPVIIQSAGRAMEVISGHAAILQRPDNCVEVYSSWRSWPCLLPQHGPGKKHERSLTLRRWQQALIDRWPDQLLRGLIESDGCRFLNTGRGGWSCPRYAFSNRSADIHGFFHDACERLGAAWTAAGPHTTYVSRKADVARLDEFIGPKR